MHRGGCRSPYCNRSVFRNSVGPPFADWPIRGTRGLGVIGHGDCIAELFLSALWRCDIWTRARLSPQVPKLITTKRKSTLTSGSTLVGFSRVLLP